MDYCIKCHRSTAPGSGNFVDRVQELDNLFICRECADVKYDMRPECDKGTFVAHTFINGELVEVLPIELTEVLELQDPSYPDYFEFCEKLKQLKVSESLTEKVNKHGEDHVEVWLRLA